MKKILAAKLFSLNSLLLSIILAVSAFFRLYRIEDYLTFLGDEGRDVLVVLHILRGDLTFIGPRASAGDFFLGPIYYYMITPFLFLANYNPVGPAIMVALIGIATVFLVYFVSSRFFGKWPALAAAALYAVSPLIVLYSRSSWNPNPMPFFSLLSLYLLYLGVKENSWKKLVIVGLLLGIAMQLHYLATFLAVIIAVYVIVANIILKKTRLTEIRSIIFQYFEILAGFLIGFVPFIAFEIKNGFPNTQTIFKFIFQDTLANKYEGQNATFIDIVKDTTFHLFGRTLAAFPFDAKLKLFTNQELQIWSIVVVILIFATTIALIKVKDKLQLTLLVCWLVIGIFLFGFYKKQIYDYYFGFLFPLPFIMFANLLNVISSSKKKKFHTAGLIASIVLFAGLLALNLINYPFKEPPNQQKNQMKTIAEFIMAKTGQEPYNFALISGGNTDHAYRYFFELENKPPVTIENNLTDPERKTVTKQLFVVCEQECSPLGHGLWEIAGFGRAQIVDEWSVSVSKIYKLEHYEGEEE